MDPLSISAACISLIAGIAKISVEVSSFIRDVRDAHKELDAVSRELSSLSISLSALADDSEKHSHIFQPRLGENVHIVVKNCDQVVAEIGAVLGKMSKSSITQKAQWVTYGRSEISKL
jgi:hypothetical protein